MGYIEDFNVTLSAASWSGSAAPYTYTISNASLKANGNYVIDPQTSISLATLKIAARASIIGGTRSNGALTLLALGVKPTVDIPVIVSGGAAA
jgi:hypothetical protein